MDSVEKVAYAPTADELSMQKANLLPSQKEKDVLIRMAALAQLMYKGPENQLLISCVNELFPRCLVLMPSPELLGVSLPIGLKVQAYRHGDEIIIGIRGTELNKDLSTKLMNFMADAAIGRHKSDEDIIDSVLTVCSEVQERYGFAVSSENLEFFKGLIRGRIHGDTEFERASTFVGSVFSAIPTGFMGGLRALWANPLKSAAVVTAGIAATMLTGGATLIPAAVASFGTVTGAAGAIGTAVSSASELFKGFSGMDGYPTLLSYVVAIEEYKTKLQDAGIIKTSDTQITVGHSLGGFLAGVTGASGDEIYSFNGPGVNFEKDVVNIYKNAGLAPKINPHVAYHSISLGGDFIGNLGKRSGPIHRLALPMAKYGSPLAHHGIDLMRSTFTNITVNSIPKGPLLLEDQKPESEIAGI